MIRKFINLCWTLSQFFSIPSLQTKNKILQIFEIPQQLVLVINIINITEDDILIIKELKSTKASDYDLIADTII